MKTRLAGSYRFAAFTLLNTALLLLAVELIASTLLHIPTGQTATAEHEDYYATVSWGADWERDGGDVPQGYEPFVTWKAKPFRSKVINVDQSGNRVTPGADCRTGSYQVLVLGGSTVWGSGVPDWGTIPAYLQGLMAATRDRPVCVRNLGQGGWVSTQGVIELQRQLQAAEAPDLVILYDGPNDIEAGSEEGTAGNHVEILELRARFEDLGQASFAMRLFNKTGIFSLMERLAPSMSGLRLWPAGYRQRAIGREELADNVVRVYLANYRAVHALSQEYGFEFAFFWQPNLVYEKKPLTAQERRILDERMAEFPALGALLPVAYEKIRAASPSHDRLFYLGDVFENEPRRIYLSDSHISPEGNLVVAKQIVERLIGLTK